MNNTLNKLAEAINNFDSSDLLLILDFIPIPLIPVIGILTYKTRPKVSVEITTDYIHADSATHTREYLISLSYGWGNKPIGKFVADKLFPVHILDVLPKTKLEYYYIPRDDSEAHIPKICTREDFTILDALTSWNTFQRFILPHFLKSKNQKPNDKKISILNLDELKKHKISIFYVITYDDEQSNFTNQISLDYYPNTSAPTKIEIRNGNKITIKSFEFQLTAEQTKYLKTKTQHFPKSIKWKNINIEDCYVDPDGKLRITIAQIPKQSVEQSGKIILNLI